MTAVIAQQHAAPGQNAWTAPLLAYGGYLAACLALLHPTALGMADTWTSASSYAHGFLVAPLTLWMIARTRTNAAPVSGFCFLPAVVAAAALWLMGRAAGVSLIEQATFICLLIAGVGLIFGGPVLRAWSFPLTFLFFMVPFGESLTPFLQTITAQGALASLNIIGVTAALDGYVIRTGAGAFEIARACAGLNFLLASLMLAALFGHLAIARWRDRAAFLAIAIMVALVANLIRAVLVIWIASVTQMRWAIGADHIAIGIVLYATVIAILMTVGMRMANAPQQTAPPKNSPEENASPSWRWPSTAAGIGAVIAASFYAHAVVDRPMTRSAPPALSLFDAPSWRILPPPKNWNAEITAADRRAAATYDRRGARVYAAIGYFTHDRPQAEIINYHHRAWDGLYWRKTETGRAEFSFGGREYDTHVDYLSAPEGRRIAAVTLYWRDGAVYADPVRFKLDQMIGKLRGRNPPGGIVIIAAAYQEAPAEALETLRAFGRDVEPFANWLSRQREY